MSRAMTTIEAKDRFGDSVTISCELTVTGWWSVSAIIDNQLETCKYSGSEYTPDESIRDFCNEFHLTIYNAQNRV